MARKPAHSILALVAVALATGLTVPAGAGAVSGCTKVASPTGSDSASGTEAAPYRTFQKLVSSLSPGAVACLRTGTYTGADVYLKTPDVTLQSYPGEKATIGAFLEVFPEAARSRVQGLRFDGSLNSNAAALKIQANDAVFADNDVTKGGEGICVLAGSWNPAQRIVIERNRIYNCGPAGTKYDHQIYLGQSRGAIVRWNQLYGNGGGWGVHMYPDADGTLVEHNVIDGNTGGVVFAGDGSGKTSDNNTVRNNAITYSGMRWNAEGSWSGGPAGSGNTVHDNCVYSTGESSPSGIAAQNGFSAFSNTVLSGSPYVDRSARDYRFNSGSPCAALVGDVAGAPVGGTAPPPPSGTNTAPDTTAPDTSVTSAPPSSTSSTAASFAFAASESGVTFQCRLDGGSWSSCSSPKAYSGLAVGAHVFDVRATDAAGNVDPTPATRRWTIVREDKALRKPASASGRTKYSSDPARANDGDSTTRWAGPAKVNQWWQVDLGRSRQVDTVSLNWYAGSYSTYYRILVSTDGVHFRKTAVLSNDSGGWKTTRFAAASARYVRVYGVTLSGSTGMALYDAEVYGPAD